MKTTNTTVSKITSTKKRGRPVRSKKMDKLNKINSEISKKTHELLALYPAKEYMEEELSDSEATVEQVKNWSRFKPQVQIVEQMSLTNKITLVLTAVNVAILISLVIKNV